MEKFVQFVLPNGEGDLYVKKSAIQEIKDTGEVDPELGWCISQVILTDGRRHSVVGPANCLFLDTFESPIIREIKRLKDKIKSSTPVLLAEAVK